MQTKGLKTMKKAAGLEGWRLLMLRCVRLVQLRRQGHAADALVMTLDGGSQLTLALGGGLLIKLTGAQLGQETRLFDSTLEAANRHLERLVFLDTNVRHKNHPLPSGAYPVKFWVVRANLFRTLRRAKHSKREKL